MKRLLLTLTGVLAMMTVFAQDLSVRASKGYTLKPDAPAIGATSYQWYEKVNDGAFSEVSGETGASLTIEAETRAAGDYAYVRMAANAECPEGVPSNTFTVRVCTNQEQGNCTYTETAPVSTFANFVPDNYASSTSLSLTDERDNKIYPVVKLGGRWIMARNLNYQGTTGIPSSTLTFNSASNKPVETSGGGVQALIGQFWCPGGYSSSAVTSSTYSCEVWGALYTWETAMSFDGKGSWSESAHTYNPNGGAANSDAAKANHGRTGSGLGTGGRGICPVNWHVPTDNEWGIILDGIEDDGTGTGTHHQNANSTGYIGTNAGKYGKSACTVPDNSTSGNTYVNDDNANWYYHTNKGNDKYGFRVLPSGYRNYDGFHFYGRGSNAYFWSSSAYSSTYAWDQNFNYKNATVSRNYNNRSYGSSVRCIRDSD